MERNTKAVEPLIVSHSNFAEMLAADLEQSSDIFQSRQLTAGAPAPGLADDGSRRRYSMQRGSNYLSPMRPSQPLPNSKSLQSVHQKYSDIFSPLDFNPPKRDSISSSGSSANLEPLSISTREESVLTVDTWLESEKHPSPTFLHISPTSESTAQMSWIDLDAEEISPITQRRRSSMSDFPQYIHQLRSQNETHIKTIDGMPPGYPTEIRRRRSSLQHQEANAATQQFTQYVDQGELYRDTPHITSYGPPDDELHFTYENSVETSFPEDEADFAFQDNIRASLHSDPASPTSKEDTTKRPNANGNRSTGIASAEVGFDEWLESDMAQFACEDQLLPRPLPHNIQETVKFFVTNFPEAMLLCNSLLIENIRTLSQEVRYNTDDPQSDHPATLGQQPNNQQQSKPSKWKWLGSSGSATEQQSQPGTISATSKQEWDVIRKIFPYGSDGLCEALYAYVLVYNYITSLCLRSPHHPIDLSRPITPWTGTRPSTSKSTASSDIDMYAPTPSQPSVSENGISRKAASILGMNGEGVVVARPSLSLSRPPSGGSGRRTPTFTGLRSIPSFLFNGTSQGHHRQSESKGIITTPLGQRSNFSRPVTPTGRTGMRPITSMGSRGADQGKQLADLRHGVAMCCARLTVTLHRADPTITKRKSDKDCKVDPSFMRSLCENVRITEEAIGRPR
ncbi:hypothetical protein E0Z10_g7611 [Xylaria hypoxylon]|uniref:Uncharacterized protein n=1 Tax=Xylaria hypoxylon TaxID=37992 RepID=A0A4Z0YPQ1_9PEZI|nr:hypothetical protein E0Z10_g7611 [Xylaria hypoxylon]